MIAVTEALVDAKNEARQAETRTEIADALLKVLEGQRQSEPCRIPAGHVDDHVGVHRRRGGGYRNRSSPMTRRP